MKLDLRVLLPLAAASCLNQPNFVSINPDHGYEDGCIDVVLQGHHLGTKAKGSVGGADFLSIEPAERDPKRPDHAQDVGFLYTAVVPPGTKGWADVQMVVDGEKHTINDGFYFESCPASVHVDFVDVADPVAPGGFVSFWGCGLSVATSVDFYLFTGTTTTGLPPALPVANVPVLPTCSTAQAEAEVPNLPPGTYRIAVVHDDGTVYNGPCFSDSGDTGLTCEPVLVTVGGAK